MPPLDPDKPFEKSCRNLPVAYASIVPMARVHVKPWGVQVAGNFNRAAAIRQYQRVREQLPDVLSEYDPVVSRVRSPRGRRGIYAVRIGADTRADADAVCAQLRSAGGACMVTRNR